MLLFCVRVLNFKIFCHTHYSPSVQLRSPVGMDDHANGVFGKVSKKIRNHGKEVVVFRRWDDANSRTIQPENNGMIVWCSARHVIQALAQPRFCRRHGCALCPVNRGRKNSKIAVDETCNHLPGTQMAVL